MRQEFPHDGTKRAFGGSACSSCQKNARIFTAFLCARPCIERTGPPLHSVVRRCEIMRLGLVRLLCMVLLAGAASVQIMVLGG